MAVETRFVVVRNGEELKTFMDKKQADQYDIMLDRADALSEVINKSPLELDEAQLEKLSIYLAENRDDVLVALGAKKVAKPKKVATDLKEDVPTEKDESK